MGKNKWHRLITIKSKVDGCDQVCSLRTTDELAAFIGCNFTGSGFCVVYLDYRVFVGRYEKKDEQEEAGGQMFFYRNRQVEPRFLKRLRVFNQERELFIWRAQGGFRWRLRIDDGTGDTQDGGKEVDVVEAEQILWGTRAESICEGWTRIYEDRGTEIILPGENLNVDLDNRVKLVTRNYIEYNDLGQAGYVDCRFVKFNWGGGTVDKEK